MDNYVIRKGVSKFRYFKNFTFGWGNQSEEIWTEDINQAMLMNINSPNAVNKRPLDEGEILVKVISKTVICPVE